MNKRANNLPITNTKLVLVPIKKLLSKSFHFKSGLGNINSKIFIITIISSNLYVYFIDKSKEVLKFFSPPQIHGCRVKWNKNCIPLYDLVL